MTVFGTIISGPSIPIVPAAFLSAGRRVGSPATIRQLTDASPSGDHIRKVEIAQRKPDAAISSLAVMSGVVWVGGLDDDGMCELHPTANDMLAIAHHYSTAEFPNATIHEIKLT